MPRTDLREPLNRSVESSNGAGFGHSLAGQSNASAGPQPQPASPPTIGSQPPRGTHHRLAAGPKVGAVRLARRSGRERRREWGRSHGESDSDGDGCWARAKRRNFVLLRGFAVLTIHFGIGMLGCKCELAVPSARTARHFRHLSPCKTPF